MSEKAVFEIQGSSLDLYVVTVHFSPLTISCTCTAGQNGLICKHRLGILSGENPGIVKGDLSLLPKIKATAAETPLSEMFEKYDSAKEAKKAAIKKAEAAFKNYREAREDLAQKKAKTDKAVLKHREAMEAAIDKTAETETAAAAALKELQTIFIFPLK